MGATTPARLPITVRIVPDGDEEHVAGPAFYR
jgi:hypothetical protein